MDNNPQQFCLKWHNHQTSLLSTLPLLLDQSHLTDVTIVAENKNFKAHRIVLSSCSKFFFELFNSIDQTHHPVIVIPGSTAATMAALLTFMYCGQVNVFETEIPQLLSLSETLGIKGLAEFQNNMKNSNKNSSPEVKMSPQPKQQIPIENLFMKSFQLYPNLLPQPLNFSQSALNKTNELLEKYKQQVNIIQQNIKDNENSGTESIKRNHTGDRKFNKDIKNIDKIAESLRAHSDSNCNIINTNNNNNSNNNLINNDNNNNISKNNNNDSNIDINKSNNDNDVIQQNITSCHSSPSPSTTNPINFSAIPPHFLSDHEDLNKSTESISIDENLQLIPGFNISADNLHKTKISNDKLNLQQKVSNSKLYATCFICHKILSNQYNLRVHLETHQNVRYACNICTHVSRSKDALRKHVSYRHPTAPSLCESETRRKRKGIITTNPTAIAMTKLEIEDRLLSAQANSPFLFLSNQYSSAIADNQNISTPPSSLPEITIETNFKQENMEHPKST